MNNNRGRRGHIDSQVSDWVQFHTRPEPVPEPVPEPRAPRVHEPFTRLDSKTALELGCTVREISQDGDWYDTIPAEFESLLSPLR